MFSKRLPIRARFVATYYLLSFSRAVSKNITRLSYIYLRFSLSLARQLASNLKMLRAFPRVAYDFNDKIYGRPASHSRIYLAFRERATRPFYFRLPLAIHFLMYAPDEREGGRVKPWKGVDATEGLFEKKAESTLLFGCDFYFTRDSFFFFFPTYSLRARTSRLIPWHPNKQFTRN